MPGFFDLIGNVQRTKGKHSVRQERIMREGSEPFLWTPTAIAAGGSAYIKVSHEFPDARKYEPLDWMEVSNNEPNINILVKINGKKEVSHIPAKTMRTISNLQIHTVEIVNESTTTATTEKRVRVTIQRLPAVRPYVPQQGEM